MSVWKYKIPIMGKGEVKRVLQLLEDEGYLLNDEYRMRGLQDEQFQMIEENQVRGGLKYVTYNNEGCICKKVFELGQETDCHCEISIEDFIKLDLINK